ncbi:hypothetical protein BS47DRAFT_1360942 [Hydnum rufescens UP504]|uniref:Uncharacterized protein n=1 Tax=Hydnum rufescens UP504 TaxID=1448309 RepID=A0A9P6B0Y0_9AGAM|nr:hypothetical protein BS47DRAFT_1360942 [Hydnum rufescens UP504]
MDHGLSNIGIAKKERGNLMHLCLTWHPGSKHKNELKDITQGSNAHMYKHSQVLEPGPIKKGSASILSSTTRTPGDADKDNEAHSIRQLTMLSHLRMGWFPWD